jgi:hypothetical protein
MTMEVIVVAMILMMTMTTMTMEPLKGFEPKQTAAISNRGTESA